MRRPNETMLGRLGVLTSLDVSGTNADDKPRVLGSKAGREDEQNGENRKDRFTLHDCISLGFLTPVQTDGFPESRPIIAQKKAITTLIDYNAVGTAKPNSLPS